LLIAYNLKGTPSSSWLVDRRKEVFLYSGRQAKKQFFPEKALPILLNLKLF